MDTEKDLMEPEKDLWYWLAVIVAIIAMFAWAVMIALNVGGPFGPWLAIGIMVFAAGSVGVRAWLRARKIVWTQELREEYRQQAKQRSRQQVLELIPTLASSLILLILLGLVSAKLLPSWVGLLLLLAGLVFSGWLRQRIHNQR